MTRTIRFLALPLAVVALVYFAGCNDSTTAPTQSDTQRPSSVASPKEAAHAHKPGGHGGIIVEIGRDNFHAEAVFEKGGRLRLYTLGKDESRVQEVQTQTLTAYARLEGSAESSSFLLKAEPLPGDTQGRTSQFVGKLPGNLSGQPVEVTIPSFQIGGERFRLGFTSTRGGHDEDMPDAVSADAERTLYLTGKGGYTTADVQANGNITAAKKYKGFRAAHDLKPRAGDLICPVTLTRANSSCTWVIGGKTYEFCCPPCIDEFVSLAREQPATIKEPEAYRKK